MHEPHPREILKPLDLAVRLATLAKDKAATETVILDLREVGAFTDFFVICSAASERQARAISEHVREQLKRDDLLPRGVAGENEGSWILLDYLDVVFHVFTSTAREFYGLEELWADAPEVDVASD